MSGNNNSTCYNGKDEKEWKKSIQDIHVMQTAVLPKIVFHWDSPKPYRFDICHDMDHERVYVTQSFPVIPNFDFEDLTDGYAAIEFCKNQVGNIDTTKGTKKESEMDTFWRKIGLSYMA